MTQIINDKNQQNKIKELALPVFDLIENLLHDNNLNLHTKRTICNAVIKLNKSIFARKWMKPTWSIVDIQKSFNDIICAIPVSYWKHLDQTPFRKMIEYLNSFGPHENRIVDIPKYNHSLLTRIKQFFYVNAKEK